jgi:porphobilinogen synthase
MPGVRRHKIDELVKVVEQAYTLEVPAVALFPVVPLDKKDALGQEAFNANNLICRAVRAIKSSVPDIGVITDVALDPYTKHGHDGVLSDDGEVDNDRTVEILAKQALVLAGAGSDIVAPSDMMDGRVAAIRNSLDADGFEQVAILSYAAKYASSFYGPFRDAVGSGAQLKKGSKASYQMNPANTDEALREVAMDIEEGADMVMVKPGMPYLDIVYRVKKEFSVPTFAYQVSGEYAMLKSAAASGAFDEVQAMYESLLAFKRAGADGIFTYAALEIANYLDNRRK